MKTKFQQRNFLLLQNDKETEIVKSILKSPLGLAKDLIEKLFENKYEDLQDNLDKIKQFVAGIERASKLKKYNLAKYYPLMFSFHQFFNSSYRARQGKVLETVVQEILRNYTACDFVPKKVIEMQNKIKDIFNLKIKPTLDIDAFGINETDKKAILVQIRSRDDTGGTTAKGSLVDFLRDLLRTHSNSDYELDYLIAVWDERNLNQKKSTISKIFSSLKENIDIEEKDFYNNISQGVKISDKINIKLAYGTKEIAKAIFDWDGGKNKKVLKSIEKITDTIADWDDLWISYAVSSLEIENLSTYEKTNLTLLNEYLRKEKIKLDNSFNVKEIDATALNLASVWDDSKIPFPLPISKMSDKILYIRDLLFLKLIYNRVIQ